LQIQANQEWGWAERARVVADPLQMTRFVSAAPRIAELSQWKRVATRHQAGFRRPVAARDVLNEEPADRRPSCGRACSRNRRRGQITQVHPPGES